MNHKEKLYFQQKGKCNLCRNALRDDGMDVDHIKRLCDGGSNEIGNKQLLCTPCHRRKTASENQALSNDNSVFHEVLLSTMKNKPEQNYRPQTINSLHRLYKSEQLLLAPLNRTPVWDERKQRAYIWALFEGKVTPPIFVNNVRCENKRYIYDGGNRFHSICQFLEGHLLVHVPMGVHTVKGRYVSPEDGAASCYILNDAERNHFESITIDVFEWNDLTEANACELALLLNQGTPMNVSERLKLALSADTPRAILIRSIYESLSFRPLRQHNEREHVLKKLIIAVRSMVCGRSLIADLESRSARYETLANFMTCDDDVHDQRRVHNTLCGIADGLSAESARLEDFVANLKALDAGRATSHVTG